MENLNNETIIKNISTDQSEILLNIMNLYNEGKPFECDITASELKFYKQNKKQKYEIPIPKILMDVYPQREDIIKIEKWGKLPLEDESISSIVVDLPFVISPANAPSATTQIKENGNLIYKRFSAYYPVDNLYYSYYHWLSECFRVLKKDGICVFKCQSCISGGIRHNVEEFSFMAAQRLGFKMVDKFTLEAKARLISSSKYKDGQKHSRSYTSQFLIFKKETKFGSKDFIFEKLLDVCETKEENNYNDIIEK